MKLNDVKRFSAYLRTIYHSEYITVQKFCEISERQGAVIRGGATIKGNAVFEKILVILPQSG